MADAAKGFLGGLFRASVSALTTAVNNSSAIVNNPHTVIEIGTSGAPSQADVIQYGIKKRNGFVILHGPMDPSKFNGNTQQWNIIVHHPSSSNQMWSIYRSNDEEEAIRIFGLYDGTVDTLLKCDPDVIGDKKTLEKICNKLRTLNSPNKWSAGHIAAYCDYYKFFKNPLMKKYLNDQGGPLLATPLFVAIEHKNFNSVVELIASEAAMDIKDLNENNVCHIAAKSTPTILKYILDHLPPRFSPFINEINKDGMTPLAIACKFNVVENVQTLLRSNSDANVPTTNEGYPITIAVKNDSILSIKELVSHSSDQLNLRDPSDGTSAVHWASGPETLTMLLELGCDPNAANNQGQTPLHIQTRRGSLKGVLELLCHNAFPDLKDENGDTPLHIAGRLCSKSITQALISFDADVNLLNNRGESPRHLVCTSQRSDKDYMLFILDSIGAKRCPGKMLNCTEGCKHNELFKGIPPENYRGPTEQNLLQGALYAFSSNREIVARSRRNSLSCDDEVEKLTSSTATGSAVRSSLLGSHIGGRLLCLDGGGIRGLVLTQMLIYMQKEFGVPVVEVFDWISGTSTGGILALCLACKKTPMEVQAIYLRLKDKIFTGERPYSVEKMEEFLQQELGSGKKMSDIHRPRLMIATAIANSRPADFHFFRNYLSPAVIVGDFSDPCDRGPEDLLVWEVAKATGAAPSYFRLDGKYLDGGLCANNPTLDSLTELTKMSSALKAVGQTTECDAKLPSVVVSLGTGVQPRVKARASQYDISRPVGFYDAIIKVPKITNIISLLVEQATQTDGHVEERARAWCSSMGTPYFRFSPLLSTYVDLDETNDEVLVDIMWHARAELYAHHGSVVELKRLLFANGSPPPPTSS